MADSFGLGSDAEYAAWDRGNIRGLGRRGRFLRTETDADGNQCNVYELVDDDEWGITYKPERRELRETYFPDLPRR